MGRLPYARAQADDGRGLTEAIWRLATVPRGFNPNTPWIWMAGGSTYDDEENPTKSTMSSIETRAGTAMESPTSITSIRLSPRPGEVQDDLFSGGVAPLIVTTGAAMSRYRGDRVAFAWDVIGIPEGPDRQNRPLPAVTRKRSSATAAPRTPPGNCSSTSQVVRGPSPC